jgi:hypothetical protein
MVDMTNRTADIATNPHTSLFFDEGVTLANGATVLAVVVDGHHQGEVEGLIETGVLLARRDMLSERGWVTWSYRAYGATIETFWGHYDMSLFAATADLARRAGIEAEEVRA